jgi:hypothetical protein
LNKIRSSKNTNKILDIKTVEGLDQFGISWGKFEIAKHKIALFTDRIRVENTISFDLL